LTRSMNAGSRGRWVVFGFWINGIGLALLGFTELDRLSFKGTGRDILSWSLADN
jgi:hypothetical protein